MKIFTLHTIGNAILPLGDDVPNDVGDFLNSVVHSDHNPAQTNR